jgi:hypothetical protein
MHRYYREPTLQDILSDSIVRQLMAADHVDPRELRIMLTRVSTRPAADDEGWIPWPPDTSDGQTGQLASR